MYAIHNVMNILLQKLPLELVKKIIYTHKGFQTPSCRAIKPLFSSLKQNFHKFEDIALIKLKNLTPNSLLYLDYDQYAYPQDNFENITKIIIITYNFSGIRYRHFRRRIYMFN